MSTNGLTKEQIATFRRDGFLVIPDWLSPADITRMKDALDVLLSAPDLEEQHRSIFTTTDHARATDDYFLESGDKVRFFWEEHAFGADGKLVRPLKECINKVGHALHELVPAFQQVSFDPRVAAVARSLGYEHPVVPQSMYILKSAGIGGEVRPHVDGTFLFTEPQSVTGWWWPLEDCTKSNGCLWAVPGSHLHEWTRRFKRNPDGPGTVYDPSEADVYDVAGAVPLEMKAGGLVLLHSGVVHFSAANISPHSRHAYAMHVVEACKGVVYPADNWLQRVTGEFPALY